MLPRLKGPFNVVHAAALPASTTDPYWLAQKQVNTAHLAPCQDI